MFHLVLYQKERTKVFQNAVCNPSLLTLKLFMKPKFFDKNYCFQNSRPSISLSWSSSNITWIAWISMLGGRFIILKLHLSPIFGIIRPSASWTWKKMWPFFWVSDWTWSDFIKPPALLLENCLITPVYTSSEQLFCLKLLLGGLCK